MTDDAGTRADARLEAALQGADQGDPRPLYRPALRHLRERDPEAFQRALRYYETELVPAVAAEADPLAAWREYGAALARELGGGRTVELDSTGRARAVEDLAAARGLVLHVPDAADAPVLVLRYPRGASASQRAAYELLVEGRQA
ncbi:MAG: hypothetical protein ACOCVZ_00550 [Gemmatimonadota bacterium]